MTYEDYLDEIATLLTEIYTLDDDVAIGIVMRAQADDFFSPHDDDPTLCTLERAQTDTRTVFKRYKLSRRERGGEEKREEQEKSGRRERIERNED